MNTCSSTGSSIDGSNFANFDEVQKNASNGVSFNHLPRFAISPCTDIHNNQTISNLEQKNMTRHPKIGEDVSDLIYFYLNNILFKNILTVRESGGTELSPVDENASTIIFDNNTCEFSKNNNYFAQKTFDTPKKTNTEKRLSTFGNEIVIFFMLIKNLF